MNEEVLIFDNGNNKFYQSGSSSTTPIEEGEDDVTSTASETSSDGGDTYELSQSETPKALVDGEFILSTPLRDALETLNKHLNKEFNDLSVENTTTTVNFYRFYFYFFKDWAYKYIQHEWLKLATKRNANAEFVEAFIDTLEGFSLKLMNTVINMTDQNVTILIYIWIYFRIIRLYITPFHMKIMMWLVFCWMQKFVVLMK